MIFRIGSRQRQRFVTRRQRVHTRLKLFFIHAQKRSVLFYEAFIKESSRKTFDVVFLDCPKVTLRDAEILRDLRHLTSLGLPFPAKDFTHGGHKSLNNITIEGTMGGCKGP